MNAEIQKVKKDIDDLHILIRILRVEIDEIKDSILSSNEIIKNIDKIKIDFDRRVNIMIKHIEEIIKIVDNK